MLSFSYVFSRNPGFVATARPRRFIPQNAPGKIWKVSQPWEFTLKKVRECEGECEGQKGCYDRQKQTEVSTLNEILVVRRDQGYKTYWGNSHFKSFTFVEHGILEHKD